MAVLCVTRAWWGTSDSGVARGLRLKLPDRRVRVAAPALEHIPFPSIVGIRLPNGIGHSVVLEGASADRVVLADPLGGRRTMNLEEFRRAWLGTAIWAE
jgi:ABC-type bacteriocin/lantibiotic exporter with double-glycine peptidase domain